jgi:hypothetical protein
MKYIKEAREILGPIIPALIIGMIIFCAPKVIHDGYVYYKQIISEDGK